MLTFAEYNIYEEQKETMSNRNNYNGGWLVAELIMLPVTLAIVLIKMVYRALKKGCKQKKEV